MYLRKSPAKRNNDVPAAAAAAAAADEEALPLLSSPSSQQQQRTKKQKKHDMLKLVVVSKIMALWGDKDRRLGRNDVVGLVVSVVSAACLVLVFVQLPISAFRRGVFGMVRYGYSRSNRYGNPDEFPWKTMHRPALSVGGQGNVNNDDGSETGAATATLTSTEFFDNSVFYTKLRHAYDMYFPKNDRRSIQVVEKLQSVYLVPHPVPSSSSTSTSKTNNDHDSHEYYNVHDCPDTPPVGYPYEWRLWDDILTSWPADDVEHPKSGMIYNGLCIFDYQTDFNKAMRYRDAELPFVVRGDPEVARTVERWNQDHYLSALLGDVKMPTEYSESGQFMYWNTMHANRQTIKDTKWKPPTQELDMTYAEWLKVANLTDEKLLGPNMPHHYFKVAGRSGTATRSKTNQRDGSISFLADELPFYTQEHSSLYIKDNNKVNGKQINCRFGMKGVIASNHFDGERNFVTVLQGARRYILSSPPQIKNLCLFPRDHPSARHSMVDYTNPDFTEFPEFATARATEVVLQPGDSLFLPTVWFHFIVSLTLNIQCNTRSGMEMKYNEEFAPFGYA